MYKWLTSTKFPGDLGFPSKVFWCSEIPLKVCTSLWLAYYRRILTQHSLQHRGGCSLIDASFASKPRSLLIIFYSTVIKPKEQGILCYL
ncbi:unnamed protein product [Linum trigynum]|uniref:Uncharacterized protein n=1 Tax=Linum trigynum TaxID=586398 RepID=A0AAV2FGK4_9ROSI